MRDTDIYAQRENWTDPVDGVSHQVRVSFQLRIRPGAYTVGPTTTGLRHYEATETAVSMSAVRIYLGEVLTSISLDSH